MTKLHRILVGILAAQLLLALFVFWPWPSVGGAAKPLLSEIKVDDITSLSIRDDKGATIKLAKQGTGAAAWVLPDAGDYPVDATKVTPVLTKLAGLRADRPIAQTAASYKQLQVADDTFARRLEIGTSGGASRTLLIGTSAGGQASHVRVGGQDGVYLARDLASYELSTDPAAWIDTAYVKMASADVLGFTLANANGQSSFTKDDKGAWTLDGLAAGEQLDAAKVTALLDQVTALRLTRPLGKTEDPAYGLTQPLALFTLKAKSGDATKTVTLAVGAKDAAGDSYAVKLSESPYYVRVAGYGVQDLVEKKRADFLQAPPTPAVPVAPPSPWRPRHRDALECGHRAVPCCRARFRLMRCTPGSSPRAGRFHADRAVTLRLIAIMPAALVLNRAGHVVPLY